MPAILNASSPMKTGWVLTSLSVSVLMSSMGTSIANVALPTLAAELAVPFQSVQWILLAYLMAITTAVVSMGRLGDIFGRRMLLLSGIAVFTVASALCGLASSLGLLIAARALQGVGAAAMLALTMTFVAGTVPEDRAGSAMGLLGTMSAVGTALGPSLGGVLLVLFGWRAIFLINLPIGLAALSLAWKALPADADRMRADRPRVDIAGMLLLGLTLGLYAMAMTCGTGAFAPISPALFCASLLALAAFLWLEGRIRSPLIRLDMFRLPDLTAGFAMSALISAVMMATMIVGPFYLTRSLGLVAAQVGAIMSTGPLVAAMTGVPAGRAVDRFGSGSVTVAGLTAAVLGTVVLSRISPAFGVLGYLIPLVLVTAGYALFQASNNTAVMAAVGTDRRGVAAGLLNLSRNLGLISGAALLGSVFVAASGGPDVAIAGADAITAGTRGTFAAAAGLVCLALLLALNARRAAKRC